MKNDILNKRSAELREMPYSVPEGYFDTLKNDLQRRSVPAFHERRHLNRLIPYASVAAALALLVTAGTFFMKSNSESGDMTYEDYLVHSEVLTDEDFHIDIVENENEIDEEDIIEYLIYTGVTAELIEQSK